jgi:ubiquitin carboxyl-terminal hydrolase 5/13
LNSVVQLLSALPEFKSRYGTTPNGDITAHRFFSGVTPRNAPNDLLTQTARLVNALTSGVFSLPEDKLDSTAPADPKNRLAPRMFKHLIGKDHVDFKTGQQQDAAQFLQYLLEQIDRAEMKFDRDMEKTSLLFSFRTESRLLCSADNKIKYKDSAPETIWSLRIPMERAVVILAPTNEEPEQKKLKQEGEKNIPTVTFDACLDGWSADAIVDDYRWPHLGNAVHTATQKTRFKNFPRHLWVQIQRYTLGPDWQPVKLEVDLEIPDELDLTQYKAKAPKNGETLVPEEGAQAVAQPEISEAALGQLMDMGFGMNGCKRALTAVGGSDAEGAMNWIFEHNMDPDFNDPLPESSGAPARAAGGDGVDDAVVTSLVDSLGCFTFDQVRAALKETSGAADRAADWLFSHMVR